MAVLSCLSPRLFQRPGGRRAYEPVAAESVETSCMWAKSSSTKSQTDKEKFASDDEGIFSAIFSADSLRILLFFSAARFGFFFYDGSRSFFFVRLLFF